MPPITPPQGAQPPVTVSGEVRTLVSLLLFIHLFAVSVALAAYVAPSGLEEQVRTLLAPYLTTLNFDLNPNAYPTGRFYLTHAEAEDIDAVIHVDATLPDGSERSLTIPEPGLWPPERHRHYQALANAAITLIENDDLQAALPRSLAGAILREWGAKTGNVSIERHKLQSMEAIGSSDRNQSDPFSPTYYEKAYEAHVLVSPSGQVDLVKKVAAVETAPVDKKVGGKPAERPTTKNRRGVEMGAVTDYFRRLTDGVADAWNRFWFTPSDPYPLGLIRLLTGGLATYLHLTLLPDVVRLYAAGGWLPAETVARLTMRGSSVSYLDYITSPGALTTVHLVGLAVLVLFTLGLWSRLTSILALVVMLSDIHRGPLLTSQFEPVLTMVMCYLCLGPSGASWSLDRVMALRRATTPIGRATIENCRFTWSATVSLRLIQVHLAMLVATMGSAKLMGITWWSGLGVWWLVTRPEARLVDFTWLGEYPINFWTHAVMAVELAFPFLVWVPLLRPLMLVLAALVWISLALVTGQVTFVLMLLVAMLSYCSPVWLRGCCVKSSTLAQPAV